MTAPPAPDGQVFSTVDELEAAVGTTLGTSSWFEIDQHRIDLFADATDDHQWIHVDPERASSGPYGTTIAHGFLTLALVVPLTSALIQLAPASAKLNYGLDRVRFINPVPAGSHVRATVELLDVTRTKAGVRTKQQVTVDLEGHDRPACIAEALSVFVLGSSEGQRPSAAAEPRT
ncbi:acyl dehydratase [Saccharopolyspora lacisalsi]|uniref:Acyl dehydratase n=1 Tax=Halosaccharopolyspora lacisalsi TaxID=1000566 RepID=A0A839DZA1_9PSEU|nr:MaoC family dehydratase [Halosaccharopolyspora lacisalsi]MBA8824078.1 acyl dehydratase [Halosaccharopolyspora lacisalsi]